MVERQIARPEFITAILAFPVIAQKHVKSRKGWFSCGRNKLFERQNTRQP
jgi:hypothetical protein